MTVDINIILNLHFLSFASLSFPYSLTRSLAYRQNSSFSSKWKEKKICGKNFNEKLKKKKTRRMNERWCRTDSTIIELNKWLVNTKHRFFSIYFSFKIMCIKKSCSYYCCCCGIVLLVLFNFLYFQRNKISKK